MSKIALVAALCAVGLGIGLTRNIEDGQVRNCEVSKDDRVDIARWATSDEHYLSKVLDASSVKGDVKRAANDKLNKASTSAENLRDRIYVCEEFVKTGKKVVDEKKLRVAEGKR